MDKAKIKIGNETIETFVAITPEEQQRGLMYREPPIPNMIFVYAEGRHNLFWMSNVKVPLDIVFCREGKIASICHGEPYSTKLIGTGVLSDLILEMPYGRAKDLSMKVGDDIKIEYHPKSLSRILLCAAYKI